MTTTKKIISYILSVILAISTISVVILSCVSNSLLNKDNIKGAFQKNDYYYSLYDIIQDSCKNYLMPSGFDEKVLDNVFSVGQVQDDVNTLIDCLYDNKKIEISTDEMRKILNENFQQEIEEKNYDVDEAGQADIRELENLIIDAYKNNIDYSEETVNHLKDYMYKIKKIIKTAIIVLIIAIVVLAIILYILNKPAIGISMFTSGMFFIILKLYSGTTIAINNIMLLNWAFSKVLSYVLNQLLQNMFIIGIILTILGILSILTHEYTIAKKENKNKN